MPLIADALLDSLELLEQSIHLFNERCVKGIRVCEQRCRELLEHSTGLAAAFVGPIGYERSAEAAIQARAEGKSIRQVLLDRGLLTEEQIDGILRPEQLTTPGVPGRRSE
ncbi:Fumarate hydratase class II [compost metagenome]